MLALLCGGLLSGCLGSVPLRPRAYDEAVRVDAVAVDFKPDGSGVLDLSLRVTNPSSDAASVSSVDFELRVDGRRVASGTQQVAVALSPEGAVPLRVFFPLASEPSPGGAEPEARKVRVTGGVVLRFGGTERRAPFDVTRSLSLSHVPPLNGPEGD
ncbi:hypothetical protein JY651_32285 [Pyxidicoccus parkwayensis]|uniref:Late embryogenesis abundant protein LEA-2 subgroup domain-containing protein n=1 Tax=Pyxidicoccus parkwayensis TaxID=2813578 RepID=A0ABX7NNC9_9BACT|nr:LEA type 2 family protein [Pyxidicoccus parkwaysis]QSQ19941.1 hypothetical protein JY651_32285 [Pyxidicoccus parkwaysis]